MTVRFLPAAVLAVAFAGLPAPVAGQSAAAGLFAEGNDLYREGEYEASRDTYLRIAAEGIRDARLFYNLGNACFKSSRLGEAIVWYERALQLEPRDADILANLRFARQVKRDREPPGEGNPLARFAGAVYAFPTLDEVAVAFAATLFSVWALACLRWLRPRTEPVLMPLLAASASAWVIAALLLSSRIYTEESAEHAIVTAQEATARSGPAGDKTPVFVLHEGTKVRIDRDEDGWYLVRLSNGSGGWMRKDAVTGI